jgi:hypothetical protein
MNGPTCVGAVTARKKRLSDRLERFQRALSAEWAPMQVQDSTTRTPLLLRAPTCQVQFESRLEHLRSAQHFGQVEHCLALFCLRVPRF